MKLKFFTSTHRLQRSHRRSLIAVSILVAFLTLGSSNLLIGAILYWDFDHSTAGLQSGSGNWDTNYGIGNRNWKSASNGTGSDVSWNQNDDAVFQTSGTSLVTLTSAISVNSITFNGAGYTIAGGTLTLTGAGTITNNTDATLSSVLAGTVGMTKLGSSILTLSGANTYTSVTTVKAGTLIMGAAAPSGSAGALGNAISDVLLGDTTGSSNASLLTGGAFTVGRAVTVQSGNTGTITLGGNTAAASSFTGAITLGTASSAKKDATFVAFAGGSVNFSGVIGENTSVAGVSNLTIGDSTHAGTVKFSNVANTYSGTTTINNGATLEITKLASGGSNSSIGNSGSSAGAGSVATDLVIDNGTLKYSGTGDTTNRLFTIGSGGAAIDASAAFNAAINFTGTGSLVADTTGSRTLTLTGASTGANTLTSVIANPTMSGTTALTKSGAGTWVLNGANTYTGTTKVSGGKLSVGSTGVVNFTVGVSISGGEFNYNSTTALSQPVTFSLSGGTLSGTGTVTGAVSVSSGNTYSAGTVVDPGTQAFTNGLALVSGSIFSWDLDATTTDPGANTANSGSYDSVTGNGSGTGIFKVVLGSNSFTDGFWNTHKTWNNIFSGSNPTFSAFAGTGVATNGLVSGEGQFTYTASTLTWTAVPEPTSAVAGILLGAGLFRRKRYQRQLA